MIGLNLIRDKIILLRKKNKANRLKPIFKKTAKVLKNNGQQPFGYCGLNV